MKRISILLLLLLVFSFALSSCMSSTTAQGGAEQQQPTSPNDGDASDTETPPASEETKKTYYRVMIGEGEGFSVIGDNPVEVEKGADVVFDVKIAPTHSFVSVSAGEYDQLTGKLTVKNVSRRLMIDFKVEPLSDGEAGKSYFYVFNGESKDTTSILSYSELTSGTLITVNALDMTKNFVGWSFGKSASLGGTIVSSERKFEFKIGSEFSDSANFVSIYPNYSEANVFYYDLLGGVVDLSSFNMSENEYYTAEYALGGRVKITLLDKYFNYAECASTFWDDGSFTREGYILREYNTKADGSGEAYSLGSKYFPVSESGESILYCIWEKADEASSFKYADYTYKKPDKVKYADAWAESGIIIEKYLGNSDKVVIPEKIGEKKVIAIASGAFENKSLTTLVLPKTIQKIEDGAFVSCASLATLYFPDSIYSLSDAMFDSATYSSFKNLIVNATMAPRYAATEYGGFAAKFCRVLSAGDEKMIIFVAGSSTYQGLGTEYLEALLDGEYRVVNYGTTRTRPGYLYMEALAHYTDENDIVVFAPENSAFMLGENIINSNMIYDFEGVNNIYRYIDISKYEGYFTAIAERNADRYTKAPVRYEVICKNYSANKYGDHLNANREKLEPHNYIDAYYVTFNERIKSIKEGAWSDVENQKKNKDYTDPTNETWTSLNRPELLSVINSAIDKVKATGAKVYFSFAPTDANAVVDEARNTEWIKAYDQLIMSVYHLDGLLGSATDYIYDHKYFYNCAYHVNDYGRTYRTYALYLDLAEIFGIESVKGIYDEGKDFSGCKFEEGSDGTPVTKVDFLN